MPRATKSEGKLDKKLPKGRPRTVHGAVSYIVHGKLPEHRAYLRRFLTTAREGLIADHGGEENMSTAQLILVDRVISKLAISRLIEEYVKESGIFNDGKLQGVLKENYLAYSNSLRLDLQALGLNEQASDRVLSPLELAKKIDRDESE